MKYSFLSVFFAMFLVEVAGVGPAWGAKPLPSLPASAPKPTPKPAVPATTPKLAKGASKSPAGGAKPTARPNEAALRRQISGAGTLPVEEIPPPAESPELRALEEAERELFPGTTGAPNSTWPSGLPTPVSAAESSPRVVVSGLPPTPPPNVPPIAEGRKDVAWLTRLTLPELPVRWDARLIRYLEFYREDPRGRAMLSLFLKKSGRYGDSIRRTFRQKGIPEDLLWVAMIESGFEPLARSPAGAVGFWQFTAESGRTYGLTVDRWVDGRLSVTASTEAAANFLGDLYRRFGSWELALAGYNMGYGGVAKVIRKYNTNDFWTLTRLEAALPWETVLYIPKIIAIAIVARNLQAFGLATVAVDPPLEFEDVRVPTGTSLASIATAAGCSVKELEQLNLELRTGRALSATGPSAKITIHVPKGKASQVALALGKTQGDATPFETIALRFGESLEQVASARRISVARLSEINAIAPGEIVRGGTVLLVPPAAVPVAPTATPSTPSPDAASAALAKPVVVVPSDRFVYPDRERLFYRVITGDTLHDIADVFRISVDDLRRWNDLDPGARLQDGMMLQVFSPMEVERTRVVVLTESEVRVLQAGSEEFFDFFESQKKRRRLTVVAKQGDTLERIGRRYNLPVASMERINRRSRSEALQPGDRVIVYATGSGSGVSDKNGAEPDTGIVPAPIKPLGTPPFPDALPTLP